MRWRAPRTGSDPRRGGAAPAGAGAGAMAAALLAGALGAAGCARQQAPPGAEVDEAPPRLESVRPEDGAVVPGLDHGLTLRFDEPVEERRALQRELLASPAYRYRVDFGFSTIEIEPREGWRDGVVYYFRIPPPFSDILGNRREEPVEVTFSTGPEVSDTRVEAAVRDRVTGDRVRDARVLFYRTDGDSVPYTAVRDTGTTHRLTSLPPGTYRAWAFRDLNANMRVEQRLEAHDSTTFELEGTDAAASLEFRIVEPDSTPPVLASATARDSQLVVLQLDDPLDPEQDFGRAEVVVRDTATGRSWPVAAVGLTPAQVGRTGAPGRDGPGRAPPDTAPDRDDGAGAVAVPDEREPAADTAPGDVAAAADTAAADDTATAPDEGWEAAARRDTAPLPSRTALVRLERPLEDGGAYRVRADGLANLQGLRGGGDTVFVFTAPEDTAPAEPAPDDTVDAPADSSSTEAAPADTAGEAPAPQGSAASGGPGGGGGPRGDTGDPRRSRHRRPW